MNNHSTTTSANKNDNALEGNKRNKKKSNRDRQAACDDNKPQPAPLQPPPPQPVMSNLSYSLIDDDHIDDQETINVGNLIIDLETSLEKEKIENEQTNNNISTGNKTSANSTSARSPTSLSTESDASGSSLTYRQRAARRRAQPRSPTSMSPCSTSPVNSTPSSPATITNNNGHTTTRTVFKSSSDDRGKLKMKITREKKTMKSEHKPVSLPTQKSPTGCSSSNSSANHTVDDQRAIYHGDTKKSSSMCSISSTKECGTSTSIGTITEPECLGPCEPGTSVSLEGIVWQETDGGILVVNVTWRGKTYVGALLDCTRHDWAPPRLCDSPASDIDLKANKGVRAKRIVTRSNGIGLDEKNLLQTTGKLRNGKGRRILPANESATCSKKQRDASDKVSGDNISAQNDAGQSAMPPLTGKEPDNATSELETPPANQESTETTDRMTEKVAPNSPMLIGCEEPNCSKKYRNLNGLQYHQSHAHSADNNPSTILDGSSSPPSDKPMNDAIGESPSETLNSQREPTRNMVEGCERNPPRLQQGQKRERTASPEVPVKHDNRPIDDSMMQPNLSDNRVPRNDSPRISYVKGMDLERRHSSSSSHSNVQRATDPSRGSPRQQLYESPHGHKSANVPSVNQQISSASLATLPASKSTSHNTKNPAQQQPPLPATTEEGMKPSGTSTGPPPAPHQANCYFNPAFLANSFNPYSMPYFPRHLFDQMTPPTIPTSNAFLTRFMNNMRVPPPPDSPSRLLSPSMPKNVPYPPFKIDPSSMPPQIPSSMPNMPPMSNAPLPPGPLPPMPPLSIAGGPPNLRMPSQGDPLLPPSSQTSFLPPAGMNPVLGMPGMGNPLGPMGGPPMPNPIDDSLAKQFPRRFN